ncbi:signal transduction histidine kinase [Candidatus Scalindua japonica]|uniref:histidine kinase n=1 Tax=Candidatus Scalindua japonica TaxID=1284222 RepID=A0A286U267_9BACT|nr:HAMP domain-containing sensor histidine kinase [Candidatus Scalindua japonica]GAX62212.1 signal transduction histidine kinase [Candidatus Scalindua japonica]
MKDKYRIKKSIRLKLISTMIGLIIGLLLMLSYIHLSTEKRTLSRELDTLTTLMREKLIERGKMLSDSLARHTENGIASFNLSNVTEIITKAVSEDKELSYAILMDFSRKAYIHTSKRELQQEELVDEAAYFAASQKQATINEYKKDGNTFLEFVVQIYAGTNPWGVLRLGFSLESLNQEIVNMKKKLLKESRRIVVWTIMTSAIFILVGGIIVFIISSRLSKPLISLTKSVRELSSENFSFSEKILVKSEDEVGVLAGAFVEMSKRLEWSYKKLEDYSRTLEQKVEERTIELREANTKLQEQDKVRTDFLSTVSHEIRTPLTLVLGFVRIINTKLENVIFPLINTDDIKADKAVNQIKKNVNIIKLEGDRLTNLINDILDISKMEAGKVDWHMETLSVDKIIRSALEVTNSFVEMYQLEIVEEIESGLPEVVGDNDKLKQVVINLISNAVKFTKEGPIICRVRKMNNEVMISIIDRGIGIAKADQERIFEKFGQVRNKVKDQPKGTGLGLAICEEIVEHHGGRIWVESEEGKGSTFKFTLPCV